MNPIIFLTGVGSLSMGTSLTDAATLAPLMKVYANQIEPRSRKYGHYYNRYYSKYSYYYEEGGRKGDTKPPSRKKLLEAIPKDV